MSYSPDYRRSEWLYDLCVHHYSSTFSIKLWEFLDEPTFDKEPVFSWFSSSGDSTLVATCIRLGDIIDDHTSCVAAPDEFITLVEISCEVDGNQLVFAEQSHSFSHHHRKDWTLQDHRIICTAQSQNKCHIPDFSLLHTGQKKSPSICFNMVWERVQSESKQLNKSQINH